MTHSNPHTLGFTAIERSGEHAEALYGLLKMRTHTISHQTLPTLEEHAHFVHNHPYRAWYLITQSDTPIGQVYLLDDNTLGLFLLAPDCDTVAAILAWVAEQHAPLPAIPSIRRGRYCVNIAPSDQQMHDILQQIGYPPIQTTYAIE